MVKCIFLLVSTAILIKYVTYVVKHASYDKPQNNSLVLYVQGCYSFLRDKYLLKILKEWLIATEKNNCLFTIINCVVRLHNTDFQ